ncbi:MAG TPA: penicillin acylase family protein [Candidatus Dormibacteraeota bacterium]|nr:penicillin acylase family protein [Candidatus Dormibacteraeota bacterium]
MIVAVIVVAALAVAAVAVLGRALRSRLPRTRGELTVAGLRAPATIVRDRVGMAHVDAQSMEDAAFAMGVVHAQERLWQLDLTRRVAAGRISEIAGPDGLGADRYLRRVGLRRIADEEASLLEGEARAMLEAYAAGVNSMIGSGRRLPLEFSLLRVRPEPWRPVDSIACAKLLALGLSLNWDSEVQRLRLLREVGPETAARLEPLYPESNPTILAATAAAPGPRAAEVLLALYQEAARWLPTAVGASNAWAVAPSRTTTGRAMLCNDPHLEPAVPSVWFAAHVRAGDDFESTGVTLPGQPFPVIGHNRRIAWGYTNSFVDSQDLVVEQFDGAGGSRYRTERGWEQSHVLREVIHVKGQGDEVEEVVVTRHGPVVERCDDLDSGRWLGFALQWTALTPACAAQALLSLQRARDWSSFRHAFATLDAPSQNVVYADVDGHIGYFCNGRIPVRRQRPSGLPVPGWDGTALWERFLTVDEAPQVFDPAGGLVITANNRIVGDRFPHYIAHDYMAGYRARRLEELLDRDGMDATHMRSVQMDLLSLPAAQVSSLLATVTCAIEPADSMRRRLAAWDGAMAADRIEPTVYEAFMLRLAERALRPLCGDAWGIAAGIDLGHPLFEYPGNLIGRVTPMLVERWAAGDEAIFDGLTTWEEVASAALEDALADLRDSLGEERRWRWGHVHRLPLRHPLATRRLLRPLLNAPGLRVGGGVDTVMATAHHPGRSFATTVFAPSWRQVIDVGNWENGCSGVLYPGQSGHRASRHHHDLSKRWLSNRQFPLTWGDAAFSGGRRLRLRPVERGLISPRARL